jgi:hypothetical protein
VSDGPLEVRRSKGNSDETAVWNRAASDSGGPSPREGDLALSALLRVHGLVVNGGIFHAFEAATEAELRASCAGFRYFGFGKVADLLEAARNEEWMEDVFNSKLFYWNEVPKGGHFAALEQPELFVAELRKSLARMR